MKKLLIYLPIIILFSACNTDEELVNPTEKEVGILSLEDQEIVDLINLAAHPIAVNPLSTSDDQLAVFDELKDARIVGLGEATHGTKEFFEMKHRIFQYLVENHDFKAFIFEIDMAEARIFNDWVQWRRDDDLLTLMRDKMIFWTWSTEEVKALLEWMRNYNNGKPSEEMLSFYGVDAQYTLYNLDQLLDIVVEVDSTLRDSIANKNEKYRDLRILYRNGFSPDEAFKEIDSGITYAKNVVKENKDEIIAELGMESYLWAEQLAKNMEQVNTHVYKFFVERTPDIRDISMAENTAWYFKLLGEDTKMVLWAHNFHIAEYYLFYTSQGAFLRRDFGEDYQIIGFSKAKGTFKAIDESASTFTLSIMEISSVPPTNSFNYLLYHSTPDQFIIPTKNNDPVLDKWLNTTRKFLNIGSIYGGDSEQYYYDSSLGRRYDYIVHFDHTNYAMQILK